MNADLYRVLATIFCLYAIQMLVLVLVPLRALTLGVPGILIGVLLGFWPAMSLATDVLVAVASDRLGRRLPLVLGGCLGIASSAFLATAQSPLAMFIGIVLFAAQMSLSVGPALAYMSEAASSAHNTRLQGYNGTVQGLGALTAAAFAGLAAERSDMAMGFGAAALASAAAIVLTWSANETVARRPAPDTRALLRGYSEAARMLAERPRLHLSSLVALTFGSVIFVTGSSFVPVFIVHTLQGSALIAGAVVAVRNVLATSLSVFFAPAIARFTLLPVTLMLNALGVIGVLALAFTSDPNSVFFWMALQGIGIAFTAATCNTLITAATRPQERALGLAANGAVFRLGTLVAPILYGALLQFANTRAIFLFAGVLGILLLAAMLIRGTTMGTILGEAPRAGRRTASEAS